MAVKIIDRQDRGAGVAAAPLFSGRFFMPRGNGMGCYAAAGHRGPK